MTDTVSAAVDAGRPGASVIRPGCDPALASPGLAEIAP